MLHALVIFYVFFQKKPAVCFFGTDIVMYYYEAFNRKKFKTTKTIF